MILKFAFFAAAILSNLDTAKWEHDKNDPPGSESVLLRADPKTHALELLVRFPAGHVIAPHTHDSNERIIVLEGQLTVREDSGAKVLNTGGYAYLPAGEVQRLSCSSSTRCTFYLAWDGSPATKPTR
jgi:quercetin dioxygenase-like cupin family protein